MYSLPGSASLMLDGRSCAFLPPSGIALRQSLYSPALFSNPGPCAPVFAPSSQLFGRRKNGTPIFRGRRRDLKP
jgi:hypothetical protein